MKLIRQQSWGNFREISTGTANRWTNHHSVCTFSYCNEKVVKESRLGIDSPRDLGKSAVFVGSIHSPWRILDEALKSENDFRVPRFLLFPLFSSFEIFNQRNNSTVLCNAKNSNHFYRSYLFRYNNKFCKNFNRFVT